MDKLQEALSVNEINQLRGNYNKLVEQCKELQAQLKAQDIRKCDFCKHRNIDCKDLKCDIV